MSQALPTSRGARPTSVSPFNRLWTGPSTGRPLDVTETASELAFAGQQGVDGDAHLGYAAEHRAELLVVEVLERKLIGLIGQRHIADFLRQRGALGQRELDELADLGARCGRVANVDEQRPRQRLVAAIDD